MNMYKNLSTKFHSINSNILIINLRRRINISLNSNRRSYSLLSLKSSHILSSFYNHSNTYGIYHYSISKLICTQEKNNIVSNLNTNNNNNSTPYTTTASNTTNDSNTSSSTNSTTNKDFLGIFVFSSICLFAIGLGTWQVKRYTYILYTHILCM